jgi:hypothetical protein
MIPSSVRRATVRRGGVLRRTLIAIVLVLVLLVVGGVLFLDSIVKTGIGTAGSHVLGVPTRAGDVSVGLLSGRTSVERLEVDNPQGYAPVKFLSLGAVEVDAPFGQLTGEKIVINRIALSDLVIDIEKGADGKLNVERIVENLKKATGADQPAEPKPEPPPGESREALVKELRLERMVVNLRNIAGGRDGVVEVKLPDLVVRDLSSKGGVDVLASELSGVVIGSVMKSVIAANIEGLGADVLGGMQGAVEGIGGVIGEGLRGAVDVGVKGAEEALKGIGKGLGDLGKGAADVVKGAGDVMKGAGESLQKGVGEALDGLFGGKKK